MSKDELSYSIHVSIPKGGSCTLNGIEKKGPITEFTSATQANPNDQQYDAQIFRLKYDRAAQGTILKYDITYHNAQGDKCTKEGKTENVPQPFSKDLVL